MGTPLGSRPVADLVAELLAAEKIAIGVAVWRPGNRDAERRLDWPLLIGGETANCRVSAKCYPNLKPLRFNLLLSYADKCIWRLDYDPPTQIHHNPFERAAGLGDYTVHGPHFHAWADNSHLATQVNLPDELACARTLPNGIQGWENGFRWFCGQTRIVQPASIPTLPTSWELI